MIMGRRAVIRWSAEWLTILDYWLIMFNNGLDRMLDDAWRCLLMLDDACRCLVMVCYVAFFTKLTGGPCGQLAAHPGLAQFLLDNAATHRHLDRSTAPAVPRPLEEIGSADQSGDGWRVDWIMMVADG